MRSATEFDNMSCVYVKFNENRTDWEGSKVISQSIILMDSN